MRKQTWILFIVAAVLIASAAGILANLQSRQKLGKPGVLTVATEDPKRLKVVLPEEVLNYTSQERPTDKMVLDTLPADTSFGTRIYKAPDGFEILHSVVLMGTDRTSLHKPQFCLEGTGWKIDAAASADHKINVAQPFPYELPVVKLVSSRVVNQNGEPQTIRGIYVYYYVADDAISAGALGFERMWLMARDLIQTGVLQRWAYISYMGYCLPGQEEATFERMKEFIAASVPKYQLTPGPNPLASAAR